jgi:Cu2+-containing amine oxidase
MKLRITFFAALAFSLLIAPQALAGPSGLAKKAAAAACRAERDALGRAGFAAAYQRPAVRNCLRAHAADALESVRNAAQECRAEREADADAFREKYGSNAGKRNAFGKCVARKVRAEMAEEAEETANAAQECKAERKADPDAFREKYGTNRNKRNAFGKCVSSQRSEADEEEEGEGSVTPPTPPAP